MRKTTRTERLIAGTLLPPAISSVVACLWMSIDMDVQLGLHALPYVVFMSYLVMTLPSIGYSFTMELIVRDWVKRRWLYYASSAGLGLIASLLLSSIDFKWRAFTGFSVLGILTATLTAIVLRKMVQAETPRFKINLSKTAE